MKWRFSPLMIIGASKQTAIFEKLRCRQIPSQDVVHLAQHFVTPSNPAGTELFATFRSRLIENRVD
ncbi:hypothetical protein D3C72_2235090 [compost metagenome]